MTEDPVRTYSDEEQKALTDHLAEMTAAVYRGDSRPRTTDLALLRDLHAALFADIRQHAGRIRDRGFGSEYLVFGPHQSHHRDVVKEGLEKVFDRTRRIVDELRRDNEAVDYDNRALHVAVWTQAEIIRIHPFEDGNGRTSRLISGHILVVLGLRPVAIEAVKQEYTEALNHYFTRHQMGPLLDLYLRLYPLGR